MDLRSLAKTITSLFPKLNESEQQIGIALYRILAQGEPVTSAVLAKATGFSYDTIDQYLKAWHGVYFDDEGSVVGFQGLALPEMDHHFEVEGVLLHTWCAWDTFFIPHLLGKSARVKSTCPVTNKEIRLTVTPMHVQDVSPAETIISVITPETAKIEEDVIQHFCHFIHFFASAEAGNQWVSEHQGTFTLSIQDAFRLGQLINEARYGSTLHEMSYK